MTNKAVITIGISASGKSTHARNWISESPNSRVEINRDNVRKALMEADGKIFHWKKWSWKREDEVTKIVNEQIYQASKDSHDIIISDLNLNESKRKALVAQLKSLKYEVELKEFPVAIEVAWERDAARENGVGHSVIASQYENWLKHSNRQKYVPDLSKPKCILVDIDGTSAKMITRSAFEWDKVGSDIPDDAVRLVVNSLPKDVAIIYMSGRDAVCQELTQEWLNNHSFRNDGLFMRAAGDMRKDTVIKEELFWKHIAYNFNVLFCIDDRPCVVRLYIELGLKVFAVGNPYIEF